MEKFVYKNKKTLKYYKDFEDTADINKAEQFNKHTYILFGGLFGGVGKQGSKTWIPTDKFGRSNKDYIRVSFEEEVKQSRKSKLNKLNNL